MPITQYLLVLCAWTAGRTEEINLCGRSPASYEDHLHAQAQLPIRACRRRSFQSPLKKFSAKRLPNQLTKLVGAKFTPLPTLLEINADAATTGPCGRALRRVLRPAIDDAYSRSLRRFAQQYIRLSEDKDLSVGMLPVTEIVLLLRTRSARRACSSKLLSSDSRATVGRFGLR
jgi:hypothetical protein